MKNALCCLPLILLPVSGPGSAAELVVERQHYAERLHGFWLERHAVDGVYVPGSQVP